MLVCIIALLVHCIEALEESDAWLQCKWLSTLLDVTNKQNSSNCSRTVPDEETAKLMSPST